MKRKTSRQANCNLGICSAEENEKKRQGKIHTIRVNVAWRSAIFREGRFRKSKPVTKEENEMESNKTSFNQSAVLFVPIRMIISQ